MNSRRGKPIFYTLLASSLIIVLYLYIKHINPSTDTETIMVCLAIFTAVAFFLEYHQNSLLNEAQFVIDLNNQFLNEGKLAEVEHDLEQFYYGVRQGKDIETLKGKLLKDYSPNKPEHQNLVNYLVHLEGVASLVNKGMLRLSSISDLMAYRYFLAVNNPAVQELELCEFSDYYQEIIELYPAWVKKLKRDEERKLKKKSKKEGRRRIKKNRKENATTSIPMYATRLDAALKKYEEDKK